MGFRNKIMIEHKNIVLCGYPVQFLLILENFCINRKLNLKKVSLYKPPLTPFWPCPAKQQGIFLSFHLRGKTNRQMLCIKGGQKGDKNWRKHVRARYLSFSGSWVYEKVHKKTSCSKPDYKMIWGDNNLPSLAVVRVEIRRSLASMAKLVARSEEQA